MGTKVDVIPIYHNQVVCFHRLQCVKKILLRLKEGLLSLRIDPSFWFHALIFIPDIANWDLAWVELVHKLADEFVNEFLWNDLYLVLLSWGGKKFDDIIPFLNFQLSKPSWTLGESLFQVLLTLGDRAGGNPGVFVSTTFHWGRLQHWCFFRLWVVFCPSIMHLLVDFSEDWKPHQAHCHIDIFFQNLLAKPQLCMSRGETNKSLQSSNWDGLRNLVLIKKLGILSERRIGGSDVIIHFFIEVRPFLRFCEREVFLEEISSQETFFLFSWRLLNFRFKHRRPLQLILLSIGHVWLDYEIVWELI